MILTQMTISATSCTRGFPVARDLGSQLNPPFEILNSPLLNAKQ